MKPAKIAMVAAILGVLALAVSRSSADSTPRWAYLPQSQQPTTRKPITLAETTGSWKFTNHQFNGTISKKTGLLTGLTSLLPTPVKIISSDKSGLRIIIENMKSHRIISLRSLKKEKIGQGGKGHAHFKKIECWIGSNSPEVALAKVNYEIFNNCLKIKIKITYLVTDDSPYRIIVAQGFDPAQWPRARYYFGPESSSDAFKSQYSFKAGEVYNSKWGAAMYPMGTLFRKDRYFVWGEMNLADYVVLAPNIYPDSVPAYMVNPKRIVKGKSYTFNFVYKILSAPRNNWIDALRWYAEHMYDSDPWFNEGPVRLTHKITRTLPDGNVVGFTPYFSPYPRWCSKKCQKKTESEMLRLKLTNLWFGGWNNWRETDPAKGVWINGWGQKVTAKSLKEEVRDLQKKGFKVYFYLRQGWWFKRSELESSKEFEKPPYKRWLNRNPNGTFQILAGSHPLFAKPLGWSKTSQAVWVETDFCNKQAREWYIERVKKAITAFHPNGIAWDMSYNMLGIIYNDKEPSYSDPNSDEYIGIMKVQYAIYHWLRAKYPADRVITNFANGTPSELFSDAVLIEGGVTGKKNPFTENTIALDDTPVALLGAQYTFGKARGKELESQYIKRVMLGLGTGNSWGDNSDAHRGNNFYFERWPWLLKLKQLGSFSARTSAVPLINDPHVIVTGSKNLTGAVWADSMNLLVTVYNDGPKSRRIAARINRIVLDKCDQNSKFANLSFTVIGSDGMPVENVHFTQQNSRGSILIKGSLEPGELLLGKAVGKGRGR